MRTEEQIVYEILNIVHGGKVSNDDVISERLIRSFLRKHRASKLYEKYSKGMDVDDFIFQSLGEVEFNLSSNDNYISKLPALINLELNQGVRVNKDGFWIPVVDRTSFSLSKKNIINKSFPKATFNGNSMLIYPGHLDSCNFFDNSEKENVVSLFKKEILTIDDNPKIYAEVEALLYDPDSAPGYDWTKDPWPSPSEIIDKLTTSTLARDLELLIRSSGDNIPNSKSDKINHNDTTGVRG